MIPAPDRPVALVGLMGAGKSAVARVLGERLGVAAADLDAFIEAEEGGSIAELFDRQGEAWFRRREGEVLRQALDAGVRVIACGGGVVLDPAHRALLRERCRVVWLEVSPPEAARRIREGSGRPLLAGGPPEPRLRELLASREKLYADVAHTRVSTDGRTIEQVADAAWPPGRPVPDRRHRAVAAWRIARGTGHCGAIPVAAWLVLSLAAARPRWCRSPNSRRAPGRSATLTPRPARGTGVAVDASLVLWAEVPADSKLPGAEGRLARRAGRVSLARRLAVRHGTRSRRPRRLGARVPPRQRLGMALDARTDSLGFTRPGGLAFRALSAAAAARAGVAGSRLARLAPGGVVARGRGHGGGRGREQRPARPGIGDEAGNGDAPFDVSSLEPQQRHPVAGAGRHRGFGGWIPIDLQTRAPGLSHAPRPGAAVRPHPAHRAAHDRRGAAGRDRATGGAVMRRRAVPVYAAAAALALALQTDAPSAAETKGLAATRVLAERLGPPGARGRHHAHPLGSVRGPTASSALLAVEPPRAAADFPAHR
jgi:shikimate kinase